MSLEVSSLHSKPSNLRYELSDYNDFKMATEKSKPENTDSSNGTNLSVRKSRKKSKRIIDHYVIPKLYHKYKESGDERLERISKLILKKTNQRRNTKTKNSTKSKKNSKSKSMTIKVTTPTVTVDSSENDMGQENPEEKKDETLEIPSPVVISSQPLHPSTPLSPKIIVNARKSYFPSPPASPTEKSSETAKSRTSSGKSKNNGKPKKCKKRKRNETTSEESSIQSPSAKRRANLAGDSNGGTFITPENAPSYLQRCRVDLLLNLDQYMNKLSNSLSKPNILSTKATKIKHHQEKLKKQIKAIHPSPLSSS